MAKRIDKLTPEQTARMDGWADRLQSLGPALARRIVVGDSGCWLWTGARNRGYGRIYTPDGLVYAHRAVYATLVAPVPVGLEVDHLCRVPRCVNPDHLEPVTPSENQRRGIKGILTTHCPAGHAYDDANTSFRPNGHRRCRHCHNAQERTRRAARSS